MDVGYFISELLGQHGEVNVPGLGYFAHTRVNGYYNEKEGRFYPPCYSIQFDQQSLDDDTLAQYIADNKNISLASSKYFTEKFVTSLRQQAIGSEVPLGEVGWFYTNTSGLAFRSNNSIDSDAEFFGLPTLRLFKKGINPDEQAAAMEAERLQEAASIDTATYQSDVDVPRFDTDEEHEAYLVNLTRRRRITSILVAIVLIVLFCGLTYILLQKYSPDIFEGSKKDVTPATATDTPRVRKRVPEKKPTRAIVVDSAQTPQYDEDTVSIVKRGEPDKKVAIPATETITGPRFEVLAGSFDSPEKANKAISNYKSMGIPAHILENVPGRKVKITVGTFKTWDEADALKRKLLTDHKGKLKDADLFVQPYKK
ncbi:hypothetical protein FPZ43_10390 [Mucilaginibacter pallidiroseus]|uniref:SPOR domain-containing protein n=1 Tax=Mucilaginibacter pallidiroseus TaxID=2599295 RepID=A0A563UDC3_9SPHI|nr:SPOR domain-containing protein [Mucilaginibacter pallidiroseus]TWR29355.1 hypothetical protein FPZ43_10390 [Mucilaginibacter pallidiroseus]